jgi:hypothetical protein
MGFIDSLSFNFASVRYRLKYSLYFGRVQSYDFSAAGGRREDLPKNMAQTPELVVENALKALDSLKQPTVISGIKNWIFANMARVMSRKAFANMVGKMM